LSSQDTIGIWDNGLNYLPGLRNKEEIPNSEGATFEKKRLRRLQSRSRKMDPTIWIGKEGASEALMKQVVNQLKSRELVKLKIQKAALSETGTTDLAERVVASTGSTLVEVMGHTFTVYKRKEVQKVAKSAEVPFRPRFKW
jgi:RNA-binding protein